MQYDCLQVTVGKMQAPLYKTVVLQYETTAKVTSVTKGDGESVAKKSRTWFDAPTSFFMVFLI